MHKLSCMTVMTQNPTKISLIDQNNKLVVQILGVYEWDGCNPMPPELWLCPSGIPPHLPCN